MAAVVPMERLVVVGGAGVLPPQLHLVEVEVGGAEVPLGGVDEVGVDGEAVEVPRPVREFLDAAELVTGVPRVPGRIGEVLLGRREVQPERLLGGAASRRRPESPSTTVNPRVRTSSRLASGTRTDTEILIYGPDRAPSLLRPGRRGRKATYAHPVRAIQFDMADPDFPASLVDLPEPGLPGAGVGPHRGDQRGHLRERPAPLRPQHGPVPHS